MDYKEQQLREGIVDIIDEDYEVLEFGGRGEPNIYRTTHDPMELATKIVNYLKENSYIVWNVIDPK